LLRQLLRLRVAAHLRGLDQDVAYQCLLGHLAAAAAFLEQLHQVQAAGAAHRRRDFAHLESRNRFEKYGWQVSRQPPAEITAVNA
jgi:hypothetical protein